jgi:Holliday junction DNA helicase RuvA
MISTLSGTLKSKTPTEVVIDVGGVGYAVSVSLATYEQLGGVEQRAHLFTHLVVREDALQLFGFSTVQEREVFRMLIGVSGIGPRTAQGILSGVSVEELRRHITSGNIASLTAIPNIGRKTAERLVVELREKIDKLSALEGEAATDAVEKDDARNEALLALASLGFSRQAAEKALRAVIKESNGVPLPVEELIKRSLRHIGSP